MGAYSIKESAGLIKGPRLNLTPAPCWQHHRACHVAAEQLLAYCPRQRRAEHRPDHLDLADRITASELLVEEGLHSGNGQASERMAAESRFEIQPNRRLV